MNRIKEIRKSKKLTLKQVSKETGISVSSLSAYEKQEDDKGYRKPKIENWIKLADFFNVSVSYLQGISNIKEPVKLDNIKDWRDWFKHLGVNRDDFAHGTLTEKSMQIIDKETPALFNEINIYEFTLLKKAIFNKTRGKSLKEYEKVADSISDSIKMSDITEFTRNAFKIALKALDGDKKAEACYKDISKIIDHYFGYDKFGF